MSKGGGMQTLAESSGVRLWIPGRSRTKGSLRPVHQRGRGGAPCKVWLTEDGEFSVAWKKIMVASIRAQAECARHDGAVEVHAFFRFEREGIAAPEGEGDELDWPTGRQYGDEDKLRRNLLDALTQSALLADDSQVVGGQNWKRFCRPIPDDAGGGFENPGVLVYVMPARDAAQEHPLEWLVA